MTGLINRYSNRVRPARVRTGDQTIWAWLHLDPLLLVLLTLLMGSGLIVLYSATGSVDYVQRQAIRMVIGIVALVVMAQIDPRWVRIGALPAYLGGVFLLVLVILFGTGAMGATRWLSVFGVFSFQPAEIMKLATPAMVAWFLSRYELPPRWWQLAIGITICVVPAALVVQQPDLGTALLITASGLFVLFLAGLSWWYLLAGASLLVALFPVAWVVLLRDYQKQRILTLFDPSSDPLGAGWNIIQSQTAIGSGGWSGKGFLNGTQSQLNFLPESHTDFIVAVLAEEFGFVGMVLLLFLYLAIAIRGLIVAMQGRDTFSRMLAGALVLTFFVYVIVNVGMVSGVLPVVGVPLPLVSYGGTSIVSLLAGFGVLMSLGTHKQLGGS